MTNPTKLRAALFACAVLASSSGAALAENNNPSRVRVDFDPVTGQPTCTIVSSSDLTVVPGTKITCPPAVKARPPTTTTSANGSNTSGEHSGTSDRTTTSGSTTSSSSGTETSGSGATTATDNQGQGHGPSVIAGALNGGTSAFSVLRLANFGTTAGTARVALINPADGQILGHWTSPELPSRASLQVNLATVTSGATLEATTTTIPAVIDLQISATFRGTAQHLIGDANGALADASACGGDVTAPRERLGYVPADTSNAHAWVRLVNTANAAASVTLVIRSAATGAQIGTWTPPSVASGGSVTTALASIFTTAGIDPATAGVMLDSDHLAEGLRLELTVTNGTSGAITDQTVACGI